VTSELPTGKLTHEQTKALGQRGTRKEKLLKSVDADVKSVLHQILRLQKSAKKASAKAAKAVRANANAARKPWPEQPEKPPQQKSKAAAALSALSAAGTSPAYGAPSPPAAAGSGVGSGDGSGVGSGGGGGDCGRLQTGFDFLCVLDFEATCQEGKRLANQEVIEFPSVLIDGRTGNVVDMFEQYTSPVCNPRLSSFCTELTGITQEMVSIENAQDEPVSCVLSDKYGLR